MSGAGRIKGDGSDDTYLYELKDAAKQYVLKADDLRVLYAEAVKELKEPVMLISFEKGEFTAVVQIVPTTSLDHYRESKK